jgi:hypothetical protein
MKINLIDRQRCIDLIYNHTEEFLRRLDLPEAFIAKQFYDKEEILSFRDRTFRWGQSSPASWHPLLNDCPDYHRLHDNYPKAHVKSRMHSFYYHGWYEANWEVFQRFSEIFEIKLFLGGFEPGAFVKNIPSDGEIARVVVHNYPRGGGYQSEHIDPVAAFAKLQTLVQASQIGTDFETGGLFARSEPNGKKHYLDPHTEPGDLILLSPGIHHGVDPIDIDTEFRWEGNAGRWIIMPIIVSSDYPNPAVVRPSEVLRGAAPA